MPVDGPRDLPYGVKSEREREMVYHLQTESIIHTDELIYKQKQTQTKKETYYYFFKSTGRDTLKGWLTDTQYLLSNR